MKELLPHAKSVADICCGDCSQQWEIYSQLPHLEKYTGLDIHPEIVKFNRANGIDCFCGDALDKTVLSRFIDFDVLFFGPPLSLNCDGHTLLEFRHIEPGYQDFTRLIFNELDYDGTVVCICPKSTTMGDIRRLYSHINDLRVDVGLHLIHYSVTTLTADGQTTEPRLKYVELWLSSRLENSWHVRK